MALLKSSPYSPTPDSPRRCRQVGFEVHFDADTGDCCCRLTSEDDDIDMGGSSITDKLEAAVDRLRSMLLQESDPEYARTDYLSLVSAVVSSDDTTLCSDLSPSSHRHNGRAPHHNDRTESIRGINRSCRTKMIQWMFQVVDHCEFSRESVAVAASHLDRFLSRSATLSSSSGGRGTEASRRALCDRRAYQLAALTSLYVAIKTNEPVVVTPALLSEVRQGVYTESDLRGMELDLLDALQWRASAPTALGFAAHFLALLPDEGDGQAKQRILDLVRYQVELAVTDYELSVNRPSSVVALAAIRNVLRRMSGIGHLGFIEVERFLDLIWETSEVDPRHPEIDVVMDRLLKLLEGSGSPLPEKARSTEKKSDAQTMSSTATKTQGDQRIEDMMSPVCVSFDQGTDS